MVVDLNQPRLCVAVEEYVKAKDLNSEEIKNSSKKLRVISTLNKVTHIVTNSNFTLSLVKDIGITNKKITCIYPGAQNTIYLNEEIISLK